MEIHEHRSLLLGGFYWKDSPRILRDILCLSMSAAEPLVIGPRHWPQTWRRARVRTSIEKHAVGVAPQFGDGMQIEADDCINIFLLRIVAVHAMIGDARRQAMPMRVQLLRVEVDPRVVRLGLRGFLSRPPLPSRHP